MKKYVLTDPGTGHSLLFPSKRAADNAALNFGQQATVAEVDVTYTDSRKWTPITDRDLAYYANVSVDGVRFLREEITRGDLKVEDNLWETRK